MRVRRLVRIMWRDEYDGKLHETGLGGEDRVIIEERLFGGWDEAREAMRLPPMPLDGLPHMTDDEFDMRLGENSGKAGDTGQ